MDEEKEHKLGKRAVLSWHGCGRVKQEGAPKTPTKIETTIKLLH